MLEWFIFLLSDLRGTQESCKSSYLVFNSIYEGFYRHDMMLSPSGIILEGHVSSSSRSSVK